MSQSDKTVMNTQETETIRHGQEGQLTIFFEGTMNVYDNVPIDKAQAIMLLAGESSMHDPRKRQSTTTFGGLASHQLPSVSDPEAGLDGFLEKQSIEKVNSSWWLVNDQLKSSQCKKTFSSVFLRETSRQGKKQSSLERRQKEKEEMRGRQKLGLLLSAALLLASSMAYEKQTH